MSKRLNRLIERDGAFHDKDCSSTYTPPLDDSPRYMFAHENKNIRQTWRDGKRLNVYEWEYDSPVLTFSPERGYSISLETGHEDKIDEIESKLKRIRDARFNGNEDIENICETIRDVNENVGIGNLKDMNNMGIVKSVGKEAIVNTDAAKIYLFDDGTGVYTGKREDLPSTMGINMIPILERNSFPSDEFRDYLKRGGVGIELKLLNGKEGLLRFKPSNNNKTGKSNLLDILTQREFKPFWEIEGDPVKYWGEHRIIMDNGSESIVYRNATNFNRVYLHDNDASIYLEIPKNYKYTLDTGENEKVILEGVEETLKCTFPDTADMYLFKKGGVYDNGNYWEEFYTNETFKRKVLKDIKETASTPNVENLGGNIKILSHCPYLKINGADIVHGKPPKHSTHKINCYAGGCNGKTEVIYDYE